jgi:hypothetical protein
LARTGFHPMLPEVCHDSSKGPSIIRHQCLFTIRHQCLFTIRYHNQPRLYPLIIAIADARCAGSEHASLMSTMTMASHSSTSFTFIALF